MSSQVRFWVSSSLLVVASWSTTSQAEIAPRLSVDQRGDFVLIGNTLAHNCADGVDAPVVGEVGNCGAQQDDTGADVLWSIAADGSAIASTAVEPAEASSRAVLVLPEGALVSHAVLYWSAPSGDGDSAVVTFGRSGVFSENLLAEASLTVPLDETLLYQSSVDVTALVRAQGAGAYQVSGIDVLDPVGLDSSSHYAGWWLAVFYALDSEPLRHLGLYDGLELVENADTPASAALSGFAVPAESGVAKLGVVGFEGDFGTDGDELRFGAAAPLPAAAALGGSENFFDGSRRGLDGDAFGVAGDLPRTSGAGESLSGIDLHVVDVSASLDPGQTSAEVLALTNGDRFVLSGLVLSVETALPDLQRSTQSVLDVNGPPLRPGDELEYTVDVRNDGTGAALGVTLTEPLPEAVEYVPGTLQILSGPGAAPLTDAADADAGELADRTLVVRLGTGAGGSAGGRLGPGESSQVVFRVALGLAASGSIQAQGQIDAQGEAGASTRVATDADLVAPGVTPTLVVVDACGTDADCAAPLGRCDAAQSPRVCVECLDDSSCPGLAPTCELGASVCVCVALGAEEALCDGKDDDCDGAIDEGLVGNECSAGLGACAVSGVTVCDAAGAAVCGATPASPTSEQCGNGVDDDCDDQTDVDDADCTSPLPGTGGKPDGGEFPAAVDLGGDLLDPGGESTAGEKPSAPPAAPVNPNGGRGVPRAVDDAPGAQLGGGGGCGLGAVPSPVVGWLVLGLCGAAGLRRRRRLTRA